MPGTNRANSITTRSAGLVRDLRLFVAFTRRMRLAKGLKWRVLATPASDAKASSSGNAR